ncbi:hypothetical protein DZA65_00103 [Dickeya dianthicola]|uniref:Uncharacterized protein n=1 Tax=Dickeya dianthicola TaxID=204039 RepID=A0ABX9NQ39_9GAMM|nr:hypothetical protein [Dickeya dianthicola]AYC17030.1 hypothetical protein DZA65_00103 [Dickeya dianthicola]MBI0438395.1 hypothetical protein [Dickeya dianthicola]MBI0448608.1 hypothetical protein [Dickeya dianthicola]MBI0453276.1 hypothetical protein [Dickeya dianthicola]MBI0458570.1 hypothetical protein [Dickeya dianthicola]
MKKQVIQGITDIYSCEFFRMGRQAHSGFQFVIIRAVISDGCDETDIITTLQSHNEDRKGNNMSTNDNKHSLNGRK